MTVLLGRFMKKEPEKLLFQLSVVSTVSISIHVSAVL